VSEGCFADEMRDWSLQQVINPLNLS